MYELKQPYTSKQRADFIVEYNHQQGLLIEQEKIEVAPEYESYFKNAESLYALEPNEMMDWVDVEEQIEVEVEPAVYEDVEVFDTQDVLVIDDEGNPILDEDGNPQYTKEKILVPVQEYDVYETDEEGMPVFDDEGIPIVKEHVVIPEHYKTHTEKQLVKEAVYETQAITVKRYKPVINPNYEAEQAQKEAERIAHLFLTAADVERAIYKAKGIDFDDIIALVTQLQPDGLDIKALKIELKANNFYRGNPYINAIGGLLGFSPEMLDKFFETNDYTKLLPEVENENTTNTNK